MLLLLACKKKDSPPILNSGGGNSANSKFVGTYEGILSINGGTSDATLTVQKGISNSEIKLFFGFDPSTVYIATVQDFSFLLDPKIRYEGPYTVTTTGGGELAEEEDYIYMEMEEVYEEGGFQVASPTNIWFYGVK